MKISISSVFFPPSGRAPRRGGLLLAAMVLLAAVPLHAFLTNQELRAEFDTAISRRIAHDSAGRIYLLTIDRVGDLPTVRLHLGSPSARSEADFTELARPVRIAGFSEAVISAGLVMDGHDRLHVLWTDEKGRTGYTMGLLHGAAGTPSIEWVNPATETPGALILASESSLAGDLVLDREGTPWLTWNVSRPSHQTTQYVGTWRDAHWQVRPVATGYGFAPASLLAESAGNFRLGWHDIYETSWTLAAPFAGPAGVAVPQPQPLSGSGLRPVMARTGETLLAVRESIHHQLQFSLLNTTPATFSAVAAPAVDHRFEWDTLHRQQLVVDGYGVPWLFFIDSARCTAFYTRWLGTRWGPILSAGSLIRNSARMEDNHLTIDRLAVEARTTKEGSEIALLLENTDAAPRMAFRRIAVPAPAAEPGSKLLFLDLNEIAEVDGAVLEVNAPHKQGTIIPRGAPDSFTADRTGPFVRVLKEDGLYRMWYSGYRMPPKSAGWWEGYRIGYAESRDGRTFAPVAVAPGEAGRLDANVIPGLPYVATGIYDDAGESDPARRYKALKFPSAGAHDDEARAGRMDPWSSSINGQLLVSADGLHWTSEPATMDFPGGRPQELIPQSFFRDLREPDPAKRYKAYGYSSLNAHRRAGCYAYSADARHWTAWAANPVLDPFVAGEIPVRGGIIDQIHDTIVWPMSGYYLALYQYMHDKEFLDLRLAVSRDGEHFSFVRPDGIFLAAGKAGEWDDKQLNPAVPLVDGDEIKVYYGAVNEVGDPRNGSLGLATLRLDGFTDLEIKPKRTSASFATVPLRPGHAERLVLNADARQGKVRVELVDAATKQPLQGFAAADCIPLTGDAIAQPVSWKTQAKLPAGRGAFQIRVLLEGPNAGPKIYSLSFQ